MAAGGFRSGFWVTAGVVAALYVAGLLFAILGKPTR